MVDSISYNCFVSIYVYKSSIYKAVYIKKKYCFKCEKCKCKCQPSIFNIVGNLNNYVGTIYLKCPNCKDKQKMILIKKEK